MNSGWPFIPIFSYTYTSNHFWHSNFLSIVLLSNPLNLVVAKIPIKNQKLERDDLNIRNILKINSSEFGLKKKSRLCPVVVLVICLFRHCGISII
jgi:hypothetical protein